MRRFHLTTGVLTIIIFLITGQLLRHHRPAMATLSDAARLMLRSRHIYILATGLVNLMLGLYLQAQPAGWRGVAQVAGSCLLVASSLFLVVAFFLEPERGFRPEMWWSAAGLYALFGGCMAHLVSSMGQRRP